jgi:hypothetical protein
MTEMIALPTWLVWAGAAYLVGLTIHALDCYVDRATERRIGTMTSRPDRHTGMWLVIRPTERIER